MNSLYSIVLIISALCVTVSAIPDYGNYLKLDGQVIYPSSSQIFIEPGSRLIIELQDISVTHELRTTIAQQINEAIVFPIVFSVSYDSNQIIRGHSHVLNAKIINKNDEILFVNDKRVEVKLLGAGRTTFIDVPVVLVQQRDYLSTIKLQEWPSLVGIKGDDAVDVIKKDTGFKNVFVVTDETSVTKDLRYDRVCVYVDDDGKVKRTPRPG